jgi:hypothetical protein
MTTHDNYLQTKLARINRAADDSDTACRLLHDSTNPKWWRHLMRSWAMTARARMLRGNDKRIRAVIHAIQQAEYCRDRAQALEAKP